MTHRKYTLLFGRWNIYLLQSFTFFHHFSFPSFLADDYAAISRQAESFLVLQLSFFSFLSFWTLPGTAEYPELPQFFQSGTRPEAHFLSSESFQAPQSKSPILQVRSTTPCDPCAKRTTYKKRARPASLCASTLRSGNLRGSQRLIQGSCTAHARLMMLVCVRCMFEDGLGVACEHTSGTSR